MDTLYENIKKLREACEMSQERLAQLTGYSDRSSIAKIESGQVDLQQSKIDLFAKALGVRAITLVGWDDQNEICDEISRLTSDEKDLIDAYRNLDQSGKEVVKSLLDSLEKKTTRMEGDVNVG